ncbi:carboxypeptidase-like regulatory domain-containing protein [Crocinitomix catalasitica]|uniref:carboxypeptidase-like regulatory domain-containing protein n=1 Tax=Crocinitomix catalasitica TaxID=184607 RepID=UPI0004850617|nr:carboxypeptidase-like regulatory domain-containing protein [Crocinitomix catalasitica]
MQLKFNCPIPVDSLQSKKDGLHCSACNKTITDFRGLSNTEIAKRNTPNTCGIFTKAQITNRKRALIFSKFKLAFVAVFILGISSNVLFSQDSIPSLEIDSNIVNTRYYTLFGKVTDENGQPTPFVNLILVNDSLTRKTRSDIDGNFKFELPISEFANKFVDLSARFVGYSEMKYKDIYFGTVQEIELQVKMIKSNEILIGYLHIDQRIEINLENYQTTKISGDDLRRMP